MKTLSEERAIGSPKRLLSSGQARPRPCPKRTTLTARRPALMARPAPRSAGSSTDPPAPCHAKPSSGGSRDTPSVDSSLLQPSYTPEGGLAFVTNCRPRHQTRDHHPINYLTSSTQTLKLPVDTGRRGYMIYVPINIGCCCYLCGWAESFEASNASLWPAMQAHDQTLKPIIESPPPTIGSYCLKR